MVCHAEKENPRKLSLRTKSFDFLMAEIFLFLILKPKKNCVTGPDSFHQALEINY